MRPGDKTVWRVRVGLASLVSLLGVVLLFLVVWHVPTLGGVGLPFEDWYDGAIGSDPAFQAEGRHERDGGANA